MVALRQDRGGRRHGKRGSVFAVDRCVHTEIDVVTPVRESPATAMGRPVAFLYRCSLCPWQAVESPLAETDSSTDLSRVFVSCVHPFEPSSLGHAVPMLIASPRSGSVRHTSEDAYRYFPAIQRASPP